MEITGKIEKLLERREGISGPSAGLYVAGDKTPATSSKSNKVRIMGVDPRDVS